tara:strand:- start:147 stop:572 length:426 start_codon:yes stop_codon:yes gene_type:complete
MPLLSVSTNNTYTQELRRKTFLNFVDTVSGFCYGDNIDMVVRELGVPTSNEGVILAIDNVFQLNEAMIGTFRSILDCEEISGFESRVDFDSNKIVYTVYFGIENEPKKSFCYKYSYPYLTNPLLYIGLLFIWNPQRYLFFL